MEQNRGVRSQGLSLERRKKGEERKKVAFSEL